MKKYDSFISFDRANEFKYGKWIYYRYKLLTELLTDEETIKLFTNTKGEILGGVTCKKNHSNNWKMNIFLENPKKRYEIRNLLSDRNRKLFEDTQRNEELEKEKIFE
ncbi:hypothetical protein GCM10007924_12800 [Sneathiella chinensis]|uniref:Uncharacterized protein n=2 Tax=Sneathiella chinensis TaxID=349750 RepID=A0ABQ5U2C8_9PROT|nr:hypothetical protein GCM10007924_12800 [Sneathiella chinensis]